MSHANVTTAPADTTAVSARSVLIVDDDPALVEALVDLLREEGYLVEAHTAAKDALERLSRGNRPDVVLLDYLMPGMNGDEFLRALEQIGIDVPVMLLSGMSESRLPTPRVHAVLRKPFDLERLLDALARLAA